MTIDAFDWLHRTGPNPPHAPSSDLCLNAPARPFLYEGVFAHEYQHLLENYVDFDETIMVNEGCPTTPRRSPATSTRPSRSRSRVRQPHPVLPRLQRRRDIGQSHSETRWSRELADAVGGPDRLRNGDPVRLRGRLLLHGVPRRPFRTRLAHRPAPGLGEWTGFAERTARGPRRWCQAARRDHVVGDDGGRGPGARRRVRSDRRRSRRVQHPDAERGDQLGQRPGVRRAGRAAERFGLRPPARCRRRVPRCRRCGERRVQRGEPAAQAARRVEGRQEPAEGRDEGPVLGQG